MILNKFNELATKLEYNCASMEQEVSLTNDEYKELVSEVIKMDKISKDTEVITNRRWHHTPLLPALTYSSNRIFTFMGFKFKIKIIEI